MKNINDSGIVDWGAYSSMKKAAAVEQAHTLFFISLNSSNYFLECHDATGKRTGCS
jgi:capsule polysaccharide export protein KpsC/LpsZ